MVQQFMTLQEKIQELSSQYKIVAEVNLDAWHEMTDYQTKNWFKNILSEIHKPAYHHNERIIFTLTSGDRYSNVNTAAGAILTQLQKRINEVDISNFFIILLTNDATIPIAYSQVKDFISMIRRKTFLKRMLKYRLRKMLTKSLLNSLATSRR